MKRTQLYIDDSVFRHLTLISRQKKTTVSDLVRKAIRKVYSKSVLSDPATALQASFGLWSKRADLPTTETYIRTLRSSKRAKRFGLT